MHYIFILAVILVVSFATGGHSTTFNRAYEAAARGDVARAAELFSTALRRTLHDAEAAQRKGEDEPRLFTVLR